MIDTYTIGMIAGQYGAFVTWLILTSIPLYKSFKRKQWVWFGFLTFNFFMGWFSPIFIVAILPIVYLIRFTGRATK